MTLALTSALVANKKFQSAANVKMAILLIKLEIAVRMILMAVQTALMMFKPALFVKLLSCY